MADRWPALLCKSDAAVYLAVSDRKLDELIANSRIRPVKIDSPHLMRFRRSELDDFIDALPYGDSSDDVSARSERLRGKRKLGKQLQG